MDTDINSQSVVVRASCFYEHLQETQGQLPIIMEGQRFQVVHIVTVGHACTPVTARMSFFKDKWVTRM